MNLTTDPYALAAEGLCNYCGDMNPLDHDGYWFQSNTWESDGYASCVEVVSLPDGPSGARHHLVSKQVINKPKDMRAAFKCCGVVPADQDNISAQIEACKGYGHTDPDESDWREPSVRAFIILDDGEEPEDFARYAKIHNATIATEDDVWELLAQWVGRELT